MNHYVHDFDMVIPVYSDKEDPDTLTDEELVAAFRRRVENLLNNPSEITEALGHIATNDLRI